MLVEKLFFEKIDTDSKIYVLQYKIFDTNNFQILNNLKQSINFNV